MSMPAPTHVRTLCLSLASASALAMAACGAGGDPVAVETDSGIVAVDDAQNPERVVAVDSDRPLGTDATTDADFNDSYADDGEGNVEGTRAEAQADLAERRFGNERLAELREEGFCTAMGPQTPRDIGSNVGLNRDSFALAPASSELNLCNIHTHTNAEHRGPGFSISAGDGDNGGFRCNETLDLTEAELMEYPNMDYGSVQPGDTVEVHWVHSSCDVEPGEGLGSCLTDACTDPLLRVETQVFLVVNDRDAADFMDYVKTTQRGGFAQPSALPTGTGEPVVFRGSTTGTSYNSRDVCSPLRVTWSVRPQCQKLDIATLDAWAESGNVYNEHESHGVRPLVTDARLLSPIEN